MASTVGPDLGAATEQASGMLRAQPRAPYMQRITDRRRFTCHRSNEIGDATEEPTTADNPSTFNLLLEAAKVQVLPAPTMQRVRP